jgi:tRNA dimethylallyltransferase
MEPRPDTTPLIAIVGETASGKSALALKLAQKYAGEIIAADSRTIYRGLDIGTAKPNPEERKLVPHHLLDVVNPNEPFSAADFKQRAEQAIHEISKRGHIPFLVGGSGLYIDAVLYNFAFRPKADPAVREQYLHLSVEELQGLLQEKGIGLPANSRNPRHLIRALETEGRVAAPRPLRANTLIIGLQVDRERLKQNISQRVEQMISQGFIEEVRAVAAQYGWQAPALQAPGYKAFKSYLADEISLDEAKAAFIHNDLQLAKRQRTWFKRNKSIHWVENEEQAVDLITTLLNK